MSDAMKRKFDLAVAHHRTSAGESRTSLANQKCKLCHEKIPEGDGLWVAGSRPDEGPLCRACYEEECDK